MEKLLYLNEDNFDTTIAQHKMIVVDFYADWCMPCKSMEPILETFALSQDQVVVAKLDIDTHIDVALAYDVLNIPTLLCFKDGQLHHRWTGVISKTDLESCLENEHDI